MNKSTDGLRPYLLISFFLGITFGVPSLASAQSCDAWCANSDTYNTSNSAAFGAGRYWVVRKNSGGDGLIMTMDGSLIGTAPFLFPLLTPVNPGLQYFDQRMVLALRGWDGLIYANTWNGSVWTGWAADPNKFFASSSPGIASKIPAGQTGVLVISALLHQSVCKQVVPFARRRYAANG